MRTHHLTDNIGVIASKETETLAKINCIIFRSTENKDRLHNASANLGRALKIFRNNIKISFVKSLNIKKECNYSPRKLLEIPPLPPTNIYCLHI